MLSLYALGADEVKFKLPRLREKLLSSVRTTQQFGKATLTFSTLELGHQATYTCHALSTSYTVFASFLEYIPIPPLIIPTLTLTTETWISSDTGWYI